MPYPVPLPAPPPVINFLQPEDISHPSSTAAPAIAEPLGESIPPRIRVLPPPALASETAAEGVPTSREALEAATADAQLLGSQTDAGLSVSQPEILPPTVYSTSTGQADFDVARLSQDFQRTSASRAGLAGDPTPMEIWQSAMTGVQQQSAAPGLQAPQWGTLTQLPTLEPAEPAVQSQPSLPAEIPGDLPTVLDERPAQLPNSVLPDAIPENLPNGTGQVLTVPEQGETPLPPASTPEQIIPTPGEVPSDPSGTGEPIELNADRQEYDNLQQIFFAEGNVVMQFRGAVLNADRLRVNLPNRTALAEGNVVLTRGSQVLRGDRLQYNFTQEEGRILSARGEVFLPNADTDFAATLSTDVSAGASNADITDTIPITQPPVPGQPPTATSSGGITTGINIGGDDSGTRRGGEVRRLRFEAERIDFTANGWVATNVRLTNDPFSPPELELRSPQVTFSRLSPTRSEIRARNPRVVFDRGLSLPFLRSRAVFDSQQRESGLAQFGFDQEDRGGVFVERSFNPIVTSAIQISLTPQLLIQRAIDNGGAFLDPASYGLLASLQSNVRRGTSIEGNAVFTSLDLSDLENQFRASLRARQRIGTHTLALEYSYRDRLFNGSLGFQNVQSSLGFVFTSPTIPLGTTGINLSYQVGAQAINANTDRNELLDPIRTNNRVHLSRFQASAALSRGFVLWQEAPLPATATEGLRYTPTPVTPYLILITGLTGVTSLYTNSDSQTTVTASLGILGQFGHFSRPFLDYTAFNLTYSQTLQSGESPFLFDRVDDQQVLSGGIIQQIYGPIRVGFQTSINLETNREIDTDYILEYSRRTYAITLRYNPVREVGSLGLRISDFDWGTTPQPFSGTGSGTVQGGVQR